MADSDVPDLAYERLTAQVRTMPVIEQAKGIVMARAGCGPDQAFDLLRRASQRANLKVYVLAASLVEQVAGEALPAGPGTEVRADDLDPAAGRVPGRGNRRPGRVVLPAWK